MRVVGLGFLSSVLLFFSSVRADTNLGPESSLGWWDREAFRFYLGSTLLGMGGYVRYQSDIAAVYRVAAWEVEGGAPVMDKAGVMVFSSDSVATSLSTSLAWENRIGMDWTVSPRYAWAVELFHTGLQSFYPSNVQRFESRQVSGAEPVSASQVAGLTLATHVYPDATAYGVRLMPVFRWNEQLRIYASLGYVRQGWQGTLNSQVSFNEPDQSFSWGLEDQYGTFSEMLTGVSYGVGSIFYLNAKVGIYTGVETRFFNPGERLPGLLLDDVFKLRFVDQKVVAVSARMFDDAPSSSPASLTLQLNTYVFGVNFFF